MDPLNYAKIVCTLRKSSDITVFTNLRLDESLEYPSLISTSSPIKCATAVGDLLQIRTHLLSGEAWLKLNSSQMKQAATGRQGHTQTKDGLQMLQDYYHQTIQSSIDPPETAICKVNRCCGIFQVNVICLHIKAFLVRIKGVHLISVLKVMFECKVNC